MRDVAPNAGVGKLPPPAPEPKPETSTTAKGTDRDPMTRTTTSKSPVVETYVATSKDKGGNITVHKHQDGTWSGAYPDGTPLDQTALDEIGASTPGSKTIYSGAIGEKTVPVKDVIDKALEKLGIKTPNAQKSDNANSYSDGKMAAVRGEPIDDRRVENDPAYAAGVNDGYRQRQTMQTPKTPETPETPEKPEKQTPEPKGKTESTADRLRREAAEKKLEGMEQEN
jgi:hypothetical protein